MIPAQAWAEVAELNKFYDALPPEEQAKYVKRAQLTDFKKCFDCGADYRQFRDYKDGDNLGEGNQIPPILDPQESLTV